MKKVTILLCTPDMQTAITRRCLESLSACTRQENYKLVLSDNRRDGAFSHPHELNKCLETLDTEYLVSLDDDVVLTPGWLERMLEVMERDPSAGAVGCVHTFADGTLNHSGGALYYAGGSWKSRQSVMPLDKTVYTPYVCSACSIFRRTNLRFDEEYAKYRFEVDFCYRLWEQGMNVQVVPHSVQHLVNQQMLSKCGNDPKKVRQSHERDEVIFSRIWYESGRLNRLLERIAPGLDHPEIVKEGVAHRVQNHMRGGPGELRQRMLQRLVADRLRRLATAYPEGIAVYGAGKHSHWLEKCMAGEPGMPVIRVLMDDQPQGKPSCFGVPPIDSKDFQPADGRVVLLSTDCHQKAMTEQVRRLYGFDVLCIDLYEGLPAGPYDKSALGEA